MSDSDQPMGLQRRNRELEILNEIATALNESVDLSQSLEVALSHVANLLGLRAGWVWLLREGTGAPYLAAARNLPPGLADRPEKMEGNCYCLDTFRAGDMAGAANVNVVACSRLRWLEEGTDGLAHHASIPLYARDARLGVMNVASPEWRQLSAEELRLLHTIGEMVATAVERARLYRRRAEAGAVEERNRLAREIHDTLAQGLAATALQLDTAEALLEGGAEPEQVRQVIHAALAGTRRNLEDARRSVLDLRAAPLEGRTLAEALEGLAEDLGRRSVDAADPGRVHPEVRFRATGAARPLPARIEAAFFRVAQEALANALEHAEAGKVEIVLVSAPRTLTLSIDDDGRGFDGTPSTAGRFGLVGMRERLRLIDGVLQVESTPGKGTRIEATASLDPA
jgi:two-component system, NarL family, sensor kinase